MQIISNETKLPETKDMWDFPGSPMLKTLPSNAGDVGLIPGRGGKIPHASGPKNQNIKTEAIL